MKHCFLTFHGYNYKKFKLDRRMGEGGWGYKAMEEQCISEMTDLDTSIIRKRIGNTDAVFRQENYKGGE